MNNLTQPRKHFRFNTDWYLSLKDQTPEIRLEVYEAVFAYMTFGRLTELSPLAAVAFSFIINDAVHSTRRLAVPGNPQPVEESGPASDRASIHSATQPAASGHDADSADVDSADADENGWPAALTIDKFKDWVKQTSPTIYRQHAWSLDDAKFAQLRRWLPYSDVVKYVVKFADTTFTRYDSSDSLVCFIAKRRKEEPLE